MKFAVFATKGVIRGVSEWAVMMAFVVVIFAAIDVPANRRTNDFFGFLLYSAPSRFTAALVITGVFGWLFCFGAKPFWRRGEARSATPASVADTHAN